MTESVSAGHIDLKGDYSCPEVIMLGKDNSCEPETECPYLRFLFPPLFFSFFR